MGLFREKSLERVTSPEELNDYVKAASPGVWLLLAGIVFLLAVIGVWSVFGRLDTVIRTGAVCRDGTIICYIRETEAGQLGVGMDIAVDGREYAILELSETPQALSADTDAYAMHIGNLAAGDWVYTAAAKTDLPDGVYEAVIVTESVSPMSFLVN